MWSLSLVMSECPLSGRGQGHVSNFYIVDLPILPQQVVGIQVVGLFMTPIEQWKQLDRVMVECTCLLHIAPM